LGPTALDLLGSIVEMDRERCPEYELPQKYKRKRANVGGFLSVEKKSITIIFVEKRLKRRRLIFVGTFLHVK